MYCSYFITIGTSDIYNKLLREHCILFFATVFYNYDRWFYLQGKT